MWDWIVAYLVASLAVALIVGKIINEMGSGSDFNDDCIWCGFHNDDRTDGLPGEGVGEDRKSPSL